MFQKRRLRALGRLRGSLCVVAGTVACAGTLASAGNCAPEWDTSFGVPEGFVTASVMYDDGTGPALYVGCTEQIGGSVVRGVAKRENGQWRALGSGLRNLPDGAWFDAVRAVVNDLAVFDPDGAGPLRSVLIVAGRFLSCDGLDVRTTAVAAWDGTSWSAMGNGLVDDFIPNDANFEQPNVAAVEVFDDGSGPKLYATGDFDVARPDGTLASGVAVWDGFAWKPVSNRGFSDSNPSYGEGAGSDLVVHDDGTGAALYVGGFFSRITASNASRHIARWDGTNWENVGSGIATLGVSGVDRLIEFDADGPGGNRAKLYALAGGHLIEWSGAAWTDLGRGPYGDFGGFSGVGFFGYDRVRPGVAVFDDGTGPAMYLGGYLGTCDPVEDTPVTPSTTQMVKFNGTSFSSVGDGIDLLRCSSFSNVFVGGIMHLGVFNEGGVSRLFCSGYFSGTSTVPIPYWLMWNGSVWVPMGNFGGAYETGIVTWEGPISAAVSSVVSYDPDGTGAGTPKVLIAGNFKYFQGQEFFGSAAALSDGAWVPLDQAIGADIAPVRKYFVLPRATGDELYFNGIDGVYRLENGGIVGVGQSLEHPVSELHEIDFGDGTRLYMVQSDRDVPKVLDPEAFWEVLGRNSGALAMDTSSYWNVDRYTTKAFSAVYNDGTGPKLFVAGPYAGGPMHYWDGAAWHRASAGYQPLNTPNYLSGTDVVPWLFVLNGDLYAWHDTFDAYWLSQYSCDVDMVRSTLYRWNSAGSWEVVFRKPACDAFAFFGVVGTGNDQHALFLKRAFDQDYQQRVMGSAVYELAGSDFVERPELGRFNRTRGNSLNNFAVEFPFSVLHVTEADGSNTLWFYGDLWGAGGNSPSDPAQVVSCVSSYGVARLKCATIGTACPADFNNANGIEVQDIFDFLNAWFAQTPNADFNRSGAVEVQDIFDFLSAWFTGC